MDDQRELKLQAVNEVLWRVYDHMHQAAAFVHNIKDPNMDLDKLVTQACVLETHAEKIHDNIMRGYQGPKE